MKILNMILFSRIECTGERMIPTNVNKYNNINQHTNNNLYTTQTKIYYIQQILVYKHYQRNATDLTTIKVVMNDIK